MKRALLMLVFAATPAVAQIVATTPRGAFVAQPGKEVETPTEVVAGADRVAVLDAIHNEVAIVELASGRTTRVHTAETPVAGAFIGRELYILARDAGVVEHIGGARIAVAGDLLRESNGTLYVYSRASGALTEIANDRVARHVVVAPFASDFEIAGRTAYLLFPREARIRVIDLRAMKVSGAVSVGAVPVDMAFAGGGTALTARILAVADPSAKRVWLTEATQSTAQAVARGFLRGFLGLGLFGSRSSQFPTGVDRVLIRGKQWIAYDTSSGTLYRFTKKKSSAIAKGIAPKAFAVTDEGVVYWQDGKLVAQRNGG